ncbi:hypothetical protein FRC05_005627 [Tulasnella sp. 425]|nr:hypothetical protein FRC05_005627 [Tulasnella sp. 425]
MGRDKLPHSTPDFHLGPSMQARANTNALNPGTPTTSSNGHGSSTSENSVSQSYSESVRALEPSSSNISAQSERNYSSSNVSTGMTARDITQGTASASAATGTFRFAPTGGTKSAAGHAKSDLDNLASGESASSIQTATVRTPSFTVYRPFVYGTSQHSSILSRMHQIYSTSYPLPSTSVPPATTPGISASRQQDSVNTTGWQTTETHDPDRFDILPRVKGLFRLLDLYSETGSGGLVDKIIISQESLGRFINSVLPGAYTNVTKIDFARLDREASLRLVSVYGSKSEIVRLLRSLGSIDDEVAALLLMEDDVSLNIRPSLRSGIYILSPASPSDSSSVPFVRYVIYWPEEHTWNDDATGSVRKNRVTFMRYLTSLTDQIRALISPDHEAKLVFQDVDQADDSDGNGFEMSWNDYDDADVDDRLFNFEVAKTKEQEEAVDVKAGFTIAHPAYCLSTANIPTSRGSTREVTLTPEFIDGETIQAVATTRFVPGADYTHELEESFNECRFDSDLRTMGCIIISPSVDTAGFNILLEKGNLKARDRAAYENYRSTVEKVKQRYEEEEKKALEQSNAEIKANRLLLLDQVTKYLVSLICDTYPTFKPEDILPQNPQQGETDTSQTNDPLEYFYFVCVNYKSADRAREDTLKEINFTSIHVPQFTKFKRRFRIVQRILEKNSDLSEAQRSDLVKAMPVDRNFLAALKENQTRWSKLWHLFKGNDERALEEHWKVSELDDARFLRSLSEVEQTEPIFGDSVENLRRLALWGLRQMLGVSAEKVTENMISAQETELENTAKAFFKERVELAEHEATATLRKAIVRNLFGKGEQPVLTIYDVKAKSAYQDTFSEFVLKASCSGRSEPSLETSIWALDLSEDDVQKLKENPSHMPTPRMPRSATNFRLPLNWRIRQLQIVGQKKALLIVDCPDRIRLWLFSLRTGFAVDHPLCSIPNVAGRQYVVAVDERTRLVALAMTDPSGSVILQEYLMDEKFSTMRSRGSPLSLNSWYTDGIPEFTHASFFNGTEELCLMEVTGRIRVLMIPSRSFRPASIHLHSKPLYVSSSPDGTALVIVEGSPTGTRSIRVFHRASLGSDESGIVKELPENFNSTSNFCITSAGDRQKSFLMGFDVQKQRIISAALDISRKESEYQIRASGEARNTAKQTRTIHNSLINCFSEVWERFPVAAAIQRQTLSGDGRQNASVTFVSSSASPSVSQSFKSYFRKMVQDFERLSRKPTEQRLARILVTSLPFNEVIGKTTLTSQYKAGEWITELLCLIPIHIAVTSENRFVPLKDGILDSTLERELLGAEVSKIIDAISLGWYESIFSSYMATKPVKVVSSMGEQSVGKSYTLNHMVDSSFAGSAVRTTEGVWLSVCPTKDCLVVALDFEGVHSIERTPQEDMLLVLFNTALSNLVIFRNNFALSRDVANMFTSFQASTHLFDPAANPRLFKGRLNIVIKDVVGGDKNDIVREFFAKFSQIVSKEQATNFISVLHDGQLTVIPWSVIQSKEFYALFSKLRSLLFNQTSTHGTAGEFLITLKTLMAKMKAQDWGSLDQTVIKHRVATLSDMIPAALEHGRSGSSLDADELRNLDDQEIIAHSKTNATFYVGKDETEMERTLGSLLAAWGLGPSRDSVNKVASHLNDLATSRIAHVKEWIEKNLSRFPQDNADIRNLKRDFEDLADRLRNALTIAVHLTHAQRPVTMLRNTMNPFPAGFRLATTEGMYVIPSSIFAGKLAISLVGKAATAIAPSREITKKASMHAQRKFTTTNRMKDTLVIIVWLALSGVNYASGIAQPAIISMVWMIPCHTCADKSTAVDDNAKRLGYENSHTMGSIYAKRMSIAFTIANSLARTVATYALYVLVGHLQPEHDTAHGSMVHTAWIVEGNTDAVVEVNGRLFSAQEDGAPQLCSSLCRNLGRHAHIDYCRNSNGQCQEAESEHIDVPMLPNLNRPKDWISHKVFWARTGFKDPYSTDEKAEFALCDVQCAGPEHQATATAPARPSFCALPIFHPPHPTDSQPPGNSTYVSGDGHLFGCPDPNNLRQAFHIIFVLDASGSMAATDRGPLQGQPVTELISDSNNNRLGAVLSALYGFWITLASGATGPRRDSYSVITFGWFAWTRIENDSTSTSDQLLDRLLQVRALGQTSFNAALEQARTIMADNWSTDRSPVVIFLSDGECGFNDSKICDLCNQAVARGKPLSFHAVSFGKDSSSASLRRMVAVAEKVVQDDPRDQLAPVVPCSYSDAADTIRLAETFINIANSLKKPRAALLRA